MADILALSDFPAYYRALNGGHDPFPWQIRLAEKVCAGEWPKSLDLPTGTGKTSCIDIALFAMAVRGSGPRRVFFVIDRRVVVDQAFEHMKRVAEALKQPGEKILQRVQQRLISMGGSKNEPVAAYQMRGGIYRDDSWLRSPLQPMLVASTVDQVGSRLLFRGYGGSPGVWPIQAALVANDSLILLDEAHCSTAFAETLTRVEGYRSSAWTDEYTQAPFAFVEMTATPVVERGEPFRLDGADYNNAYLRQRLFANKPATLEASKARLRETGKYAESFVAHAMKLAESPGIFRIAVMVNRVRTARLVHARLQELGCRAHLLIGRMRPIDRQALPPEIDDMGSGKARKEAEPVFVVATQCLEVGADLDFDGLVTECASIDALLQRFGRLDRTGDLSKRNVEPQAVVVASTPMTEEKYVDAVYGQSLVRTWKWLSSRGGTLNFAVCSESGNSTVRENFRASALELQNLKREAKHAPILLPAHLDAFVQTSPRPTPDPDPHVFLHGFEKGSPEVQVVWRADLTLRDTALWEEIVPLCSPVSPEAMPVPLSQFIRWVTEETDDEDGSDLEGIDSEEIDRGRKKKELRLRHPVLKWRGDRSELMEPGEPLQFGDIRPGDTLVLSEESKGWNELGHIPKERINIDAAEQARHLLRRKWTLRLTPALVKRWPELPERKAIEELASDPAAEDQAVLDAIQVYSDALNEGEWLKGFLRERPGRLRLEAYPTSESNDHAGWIIAANFSELDFGQDESSASTSVGLDQHLADVTECASEFASQLLNDKDARLAVTKAAELHDCGKADMRFQALLRGGDLFAAQFASGLLAKGKQSRSSKAVRRAQWSRSGLPDGFRHELVSLALLRKYHADQENELVLHVVASHHGWCRPFAPVVGGQKAVSWKEWQLDESEATSFAAHRLDSGVADRFWKLTRKYGWWGLAYVEAMLRLGDWKASEEEADKNARTATSRS